MRQNNIVVFHRPKSKNPPTHKWTEGLETSVQNPGPKMIEPLIDCWCNAHSSQFVRVQDSKLQHVELLSYYIQG